jgi:spoIIIJ-associated protein
VPPEPFIAPLIAFLDGVVAAAGLAGEVVVSVTDEGDLTAAIQGDKLGALIRPSGGVVEALQELSRTFLQKEAKGGSAPRLKVDVGGYRADRKIALEAFVVGVAEQVRSSGHAHAFEYMGSVDRKTIHDAVNDLADIESSSEGDDPDRYVVLSPA